MSHHSPQKRHKQATRAVMAQLDPQSRSATTVSAFIIQE